MVKEFGLFVFCEAVFFVGERVRWIWVEGWDLPRTRLRSYSHSSIELQRYEAFTSLLMNWRSFVLSLCGFLLLYLAVCVSRMTNVEVTSANPRRKINVSRLLDTETRYKWLWAALLSQMPDILWPPIVSSWYQTEVTSNDDMFPL